MGVLFPAIFCACSFAFLYAFMEETNYDRKTVGVVEDVVSITPAKLIVRKSL
jgi:hypothetical protein